MFTRWARCSGASSCRLAGGVVRRTRNVRGDTREGAWREWDGPKRSWAEARRRALERLLAEASQLGAHAVLGVQARREEAMGATGPVIEVLLTGHRGAAGPAVAAAG